MNDQHNYRFFDEPGKTLYFFTVFEPVIDLQSKVNNKKIELTIEYGCDVFYEEDKSESWINL